MWRWNGHGPWKRCGIRIHWSRSCSGRTTDLQGLFSHKKQQPWLARRRECKALVAYCPQGASQGEVSQWRQDSGPPSAVGRDRQGPGGEGIRRARPRAAGALLLEHGRAGDLPIESPGGQASGGVADGADCSTRPRPSPTSRPTCSTSTTRRRS